jgi:hypothetical protein
MKTHEAFQRNAAAHPPSDCSFAWVFTAFLAALAFRPAWRARPLRRRALAAASLLFFAVFTPFAPILRIARKDPLRLRRDPQAASYWIERNPPGPAPESIAGQF